jgi:3-oxoadipate enol-lactonase
MERWFRQRRQGDWHPWAIEAALAHDWRMVLEAGAALGAFNATGWLGDLTMPASVVLTTRDDVVPPPRQHELATLLRDAAVFPLDANHDVAVSAAGRFVGTITDAIDSVVERSA